MRIGFDGTCLANRRGFGRFSRLLLEAIARSDGPHEIVVLIDAPSAGAVSLPDGLERIVVDVADAPAVAASARGRRGIKDMLSMSRAVARAGLDLMYFPATYTFFPVWNVPRLVVTMHDTLALAHPDLVFPSRRGRLAWLAKEHLAARLADRIVTVSETSGRDLRQWFNLSPDRLRVITEGSDPIFQPARDDPRGDDVLRGRGISPHGRYFLYVGGLSPHKNVPRLIEAFERLDDPEIRLVLVGDLHDVFHSHLPEIRAAISCRGLADRVILTGFVPDAELVHIYSRAHALVQPSLMEGFGLPAVEAMACGTPVVSSRAGSLPEVVGDAGLYFDPLDPGSIRRALQEMVSSPSRRDELAEKSLERSRRFSWDRAARLLLDAFDELRPKAAQAHRPGQATRRAGPISGRPGSRSSAP